MALSNSVEVEELAKRFTACADAIHERLMKAIENNEISQPDAQLLFQDETVLRQRANGLYIDAAKSVVADLSLNQAALTEVVDTATEEIHKIKETEAFIDLAADLLVLAAAAYAAKPVPILASINEIADDLKTIREKETILMPEQKKAAQAKNGGTRKFTYGWTPDIPDKRDYLYSAALKVPAALPAAVDLRPMCSEVEDQGDLGSCTANALAGALEFLEKKDKASFVDFSRLFIYYNERAMEHTVKYDSGAMLRDGIKTIAKQGACPETEWPYIVSKFADKPTYACFNDALNHKITSYHRLQTLDEMRACLAQGFPFVFGFTVYDSFESEDVAKTGVVNLPGATEKVAGGHAVLGVGYDDNAKRFIVRNSWGTDWGQKGYFTMPYDYLADRNLSDDFWTIRMVEE